MAADVCGYIVYKIARSDLITFVPGFGVPLSLVCRAIEKIILDSTGWVHLRHSVFVGGFYYCLNAVILHVSCLVAAALYSAYCSVSVAPNHESYSATNGSYTVAYTGANAINATAANTTALRPSNATATANNASTSSGKIDDFTIFATVLTLSAVWTISFVGLLLTIKRRYVGTFVSLQTGCAFSQALFLGNDGNDEKRAHVFRFNERQWRPIRDLVRQWVLGAYAMWEALKLPWLTAALQALIPDSFMPAESLRRQNVHAPGGRRQTLHNMGALRRISFAAGDFEVASESEADAAPEIAVPSPELVDDSHGAVQPDCQVELPPPQIVPHFAACMERTKLADDDGAGSSTNSPGSAGGGLSNPQDTARLAAAAGGVVVVDICSDDP
jgi:hypothetical protein